MPDTVNEALLEFSLGQKPESRWEGSPSLQRTVAMGTATLLWVWLGHHCPLAFQRWPSSGVVVMEWGWEACRPWCQQAFSNSGLPIWGPWVGCWGSVATPGVMSEIITVNLYFLQRGPRFSQRPGTLPRSIFPARKRHR